MLDFFGLEFAVFDVANVAFGIPGGNAQWPEEYDFKSIGNTFVVKHEIDYRAPLTFTKAPVVVEVWVPRIGRSSVDFGYRIVSGGIEHLVARSRMVQLARDTHRPRPFTDEERASFDAHRGPEVVLHGW